MISKALPATIEEVIAELEAIINHCIRTKNRLGYFAALYHKVTCRVRDGILNNDFEDPARMERLDVSFANRYLLAWRQLQAGQKPTDSWDIAFKTAGKRSILILQHLLLGMNAHINLDLGIATVETSGDKELKEIRKDFIAINDVLGLLTNDVINSLRTVSPLLSLMGLHSGRNNSILIQFSIANARDGAWCFAEEIADKTIATPGKSILERDKNITLLAGGLTKSTGLMRITLWFIHLFEWRNPARIINLLRDNTPVMIKVKELIK